MGLKNGPYSFSLRKVSIHIWCNTADPDSSSLPAAAQIGNFSGLINLPRYYFLFGFLLFWLSRCGLSLFLLSHSLSPAEANSRQAASGSHQKNDRRPQWSPFPDPLGKHCREHVLVFPFAVFLMSFYLKLGVGEPIRSTLNVVLFSLILLIFGAMIYMIVYFVAIF